jgi:hypothetical protein
VAGNRSMLRAMGMRCGLLFLLCVSNAAAQGTATDIPPANPGRPTFSAPATLTPVGYLQFENGVVHAQHSAGFSHRLGVNEVIKLTFNPRFESILQIEPLVRSGEGTDRSFSAGGVSAGLQAVLVPGRASRPTIALAYFRSIYSGDAPDLDIGSSRQTAMVLVSRNLGSFHFDANGIVSEQAGERISRAQFGQTLSISHPWKKATIAGEIWHFTQPLSNGNAAGMLWSVAYPLRDGLVIDAGFNRGLTETSTRWETFAGFTYLLPRQLFHRR